MKTVFITGADGGLGIALVKEYLGRGYRVFGADIRKKAETEKLILESDGNYVFFTADVSSTSSVQDLSKNIRAHTSSLDIIINAAGIIRPQSEDVLEDFDIDGSRKLFDVNALGPLRIVKTLINLLRRGEEKLLLNISSEAGSMTTHADYINRYDYCMSKAALNIQSIILQRYLKPEGIRVLLFNPGWMHTQMGGPNAPIDPKDSALGIANLAETLKNTPTPACSGITTAPNAPGKQEKKGAPAPHSKVLAKLRSFPLPPRLGAPVILPQAPKTPGDFLLETREGYVNSIQNRRRKVAQIILNSCCSLAGTGVKINKVK